MSVTVDLGDLPAWVGTGSFFIAALTYQNSVRIKKQELACDLYAYVTRGDNGVRNLTIRNANEHPVHTISGQTFFGEPFEIPLLMPGETGRAQLEIPWSEDQLRAEILKRVGKTILETRISFNFYADEPAPGFTYRDAAGNWWHKDNKGKIKKSKSQPLWNSMSFGFDGKTLTSFVHGKSPIMTALRYLPYGLKVTWIYFWHGFIRRNKSSVHVSFTRDSNKERIRRMPVEGQ